MRRQRNMAQIKEQIKTPEKELKEMEINNLSDAEFKTLVTRMLEELSENLSSIEQIQSEMKDTLNEIKNNIWETMVEWMKLRMKLMIWNRRKQKTIRTTRRKKNSKKMRIV